jgi:hypothetical protein
MLRVASRNELAAGITSATVDNTALASFSTALNRPVIGGSVHPAEHVMQPAANGIGIGRDIGWVVWWS